MRRFVLLLAIVFAASACLIKGPVTVPTFPGCPCGATISNHGDVGEIVKCVPCPPTPEPSTPPPTPPTPGPVITPTPIVTPTPEPPAEKLPAWPKSETKWATNKDFWFTGPTADAVDQALRDVALEDQGRAGDPSACWPMSSGDCWVGPDFTCRVAALLRSRGVRAMTPPYDGCAGDLVVVQSEDQYPCGIQVHCDVVNDGAPIQRDGATRTAFVRWQPNPDTDSNTFSTCADEHPADPTVCGNPKPPRLCEIACNQGWLLDCVPRVCGREYCDSQEFVDRNECPPRNECPEGQPCDRVACERYILDNTPPHAKVLEGNITLSPHYADNAYNMWDVVGSGRFKVCSADEGVCSEELAQ